MFCDLGLSEIAGEAVFSWLSLPVTKLLLMNNADPKGFESTFSLTVKCQEMITQLKGTLRLMLPPYAFLNAHMLDISKFLFANVKKEIVSHKGSLAFNRFSCNFLV